MSIFDGAIFDGPIIFDTGDGGGSSRMQTPIGTRRGEPVSVMFFCLAVVLWLIS